jgi:TRAP-type uncharacterized transport system fused permease subunit
MSREQTPREPSMHLTRVLSSWPARIVTGAALLFGLYEVVFFFNFNYTLYSLFTKFGIELAFLRHTFQTKQGMAFVLAMVFVISFLLYPARRTPIGWVSRTGPLRPSEPCAPSTSSSCMADTRRTRRCGLSTLYSD